MENSSAITENSAWWQPCNKLQHVVYSMLNSTLLLTSLSSLFLCSCFLGLCSCNLLPWWGCLNKEFLSTWLCRFLEPYSTRDGWYSGYEKLLSISFLISANGSASHFTPCSEHNNLLTDILAHIIKAFKQLWKYYFFFSNTCVVKKWY